MLVFHDVLFEVCKESGAGVRIHIVSRVVVELTETQVSALARQSCDLSPIISS